MKENLNFKPPADCAQRWRIAEVPVFSAPLFILVLQLNLYSSVQLHTSPGILAMRLLCAGYVRQFYCYPPLLSVTSLLRNRHAAVVCCCLAGYKSNEVQPGLLRKSQIPCAVGLDGNF